MKWIVLIIASALAPLSALAQDTVRNATPPPRPPVTFPDPAPVVEIDLKASGRSNFVGMALAPALAAPVIRMLSVNVEHGEDGKISGGELRIDGRMTRAQVLDVIQAIKGKWTMPAGMAGRDVDSISLVTSNGAGRATITLK